LSFAIQFISVSQQTLTEAKPHEFDSRQYPHKTI